MDESFSIVYNSNNYQLKTGCVGKHCRGRDHDAVIVDLTQLRAHGAAVMESNHDFAGKKSKGTSVPSGRRRSTIGT